MSATATAARPATTSPDQERAELLALIDRLPQARVAVFGDLCVDAYWHLDAHGDEVSVETGLPVNRVVRQSYSLGAAGNAAVNAAAAGAGRVELVGMAGEDHFGDLLLARARAAGLVVDGVMRDPGWQTMVYAKPVGAAGEGQRLDFGAGNRLDDRAIARLATALDAAAGRSAALVLNQQVGAVLADPALTQAVNRVLARHPRLRVLVDARVGADAYPGAALKLNLREAARLLGRPAPAEPADEEVALALATELHRRRGQTVFLTRGERGLVVIDGGAATVLPGVACSGPTDPVGAGDTVTALLAAALAVGADAVTAARLANLAAAVTVRKLGTTGSASPAELRALVAGADYLHLPELAADPRRARLHPGTAIEVVRERPAARITHAIFDHDGTISTLRQGWEAVMEPMMVRALLGARHDDAPAELHRRATAAVRELIDRTTGIQTLAQMEELTGLVRAFGCVPAAEVLDCHGYKRIYNDALMARIRARLERLAAGVLEPSDFTIRGAVELLRELHRRGVRLYLASGTDQQDVADEARALGYAGLFTGGIHGAVGSLAVEAKREVMDRIVRGDGLDPAALLVVGDGPVELREGRRRGACCLGVASDEPRRYGLDPAKRTRLIRAGADLVVGDFTERGPLLALLGFT